MTALSFDKESPKCKGYKGTAGEPGFKNPSQPGTEQAVHSSRPMAQAQGRADELSCGLRV